MFFIYKILINLVFFFSPIIIIFRILKGKEDLLRFKEKIGFFSKKRKEGKLIWFHGASVGEIQSIIPLVERFEKNKEIKQILITSNTVSSSFIIKNLKLKKTIHQFFPIDCNFIPSTKGFSGPTIIISIPSSFITLFNSSKLFKSISIFSAIKLVPAFPGKQ